MTSETQTEAVAPERVDAYLVMWACLCSDVRAQAVDVPILCPGHGASQLAQPELIRAALVHFVGVHECPLGEKAKCPGVAS